MYGNGGGSGGELSDMEKLITSFDLPSAEGHHHGQDMYSPPVMSAEFSMGSGDAGGFRMSVDPCEEFWSVHGQHEQHQHQQHCAVGYGTGGGVLGGDSHEGLVMESAAVSALGLGPGVAVKNEERWEEGYRHI